MLTREEIAGLMQNLLYTTSKAAGKTKLTEWAQAHASELGMRYSSELARRRKRSAAYRV
jgi:NADH dehydrogenase